MNTATLAPQPAATSPATKTDGRRKPGTWAKDGGDFALLCAGYVEAMTVHGHSLRGLKSVHEEILRFGAWCEARGLSHPREVSKAVLERYRRHLFYYRRPMRKDGKGGEPLAMRTQYHRLGYLRTWFRWLTREDHLPANPASELTLPKVPDSLPKDILTPEEAERVLGMPDITTPLGIRDRAVLEVFYATGLRRMEIARLSIFDLDAARGVVHVRCGKGGKDRVVPVTKRALQWVERYLVEARPLLATGAIPRARLRLGKGGGSHLPKWGFLLPHGSKPEEVLFLTKFGEPFDRDSIGNIGARSIQSAEIPGKQGACHIFRHSMATGMLNNGADIRFVQEMLGHKNLETTQIYTRVSIEKLRTVHEATHPSRKEEGGASGVAQVAPD